MAAAETIMVLFTDLVGSTEAAERAGHRAYERYWEQHFAGMCEATAGRVRIEGEARDHRRSATRKSRMRPS